MSEVLKIFYADDDEDDRFLFRTALEELRVPFVLKEFENGTLLEQAVQNNTENDLIFLDMNMPQKNGLETLAALKKTIQDKKLKVIVFTTTGSEDLMKETHRLNAVRFVKKPSDFGQLRGTLKRILQHADHFKLPVPYEEFNFKLTHE